LITADKIRKIARERKFPAGVIEKDYALSWLLCGIYSSKLKDNFVFKGGTALSKVYFPKIWRLSDDLDFTVIDAMNAPKIKSLLKDCLAALNERSGMGFSVIEFHSNPGHIMVTVQFAGPLGKNRIGLDVSLDEILVEKSSKRLVDEEYGDIEKFDIFIYSLEEILAEKLRSIIQRGKSRDYFDVWMLFQMGVFDKDNIKAIFLEKCRHKKIEPSYDLFFEKVKLDEARDFWKTGLSRLMENVPDFEIVVRDLREDFEFLRSIY
jgi:predicted nucleotidyltransferase component of viral defense system